MSLASPKEASATGEASEASLDCQAQGAPVLNGSAKESAKEKDGVAPPSDAPASRRHLHVYCPVASTMDLLNGKWTLHILRELMDGRKRFNELARAVGAVSSRTLCSRLRALEEQGILTREVKNTIPPWVEYDLTEKGRALNRVIDGVVEWATVYMKEAVQECQSRDLPETDCCG